MEYTKRLIKFPKDLEEIIMKFTDTSGNTFTGEVIEMLWQQMSHREKYLNEQAEKRKKAHDKAIKQSSAPDADKAPTTIKYDSQEQKENKFIAAEYSQITGQNYQQILEMVATDPAYKTQVLAVIKKNHDD